MGDYLKMSDVFHGDVICVHMSDEAVQELAHGDDCGNNFHLEDDRFWLASSEDHMKYAAHAINEHDNLVNKNEMLVDALKECRAFIDKSHMMGISDKVDILNSIGSVLRQCAQR